MARGKATDFSCVITKNMTMKGASFLEKLLDNQPVEWKKLGEVATFYGGLTGKSKEDFNEGNAYYISYKNIYENIAVDATCLERVNVGEGERQHTVKYGDVLITGSSENLEEAGMSSAVTFESETNIYLNSFSFGIRFNEGIELSPEFTKYLFRTNMMRKQIMSTAQGVTRFNVSKKRFATIEIPLPPLSVQSRIVEILDKFTSLEAELEAELDCRKRQYIYYRELLLDFSQHNNIQWKKLGEVGIFQRGTSFQKKHFTDEGIPCIHYGQIYTRYHLSTDKTISFLSKEFAVRARKAQTGDLIIATTSENDEDVCKAIVWEGEGDVVVSNDACFYHHSLNPRYIAYYLQTEAFQKQKRSYITGTKVRRVNANDLARIEIPLPPLTEQQRIVEILDKFDTLTNSISEGLPLEIQLRKQQYEYYREQLLDFRRF